jgi:hypothetical protein
MANNFFKIQEIYKDRNGAYEVLSIGNNNLKARYLHNDEIVIKSNLTIAKRIHENIYDDEESIWFVCHQNNLWDIDQRLIGFHRKAQWKALRANNIIIYYRIGEDKIKGVFKIIKKDVNINPEFDDQGIEKKPIYQCRLELLSDDIKCPYPCKENRFSFFDKWSNMRHGGLKVQIFPATRNDLDIVALLS